jgi:hypothetical protein
MTGWTLLMETWMYATRIPAIRKYGISKEPTQAKRDLNEKMPPRARYIADNYNHLAEQPPFFLVVTTALAVMGDRSKWTVSLFILPYPGFLAGRRCREAWEKLLRSRVDELMLT